MSQYIEWNQEMFGTEGGAERKEPGDRICWMADGREARAAMRGRPQTSWYRANKVAEESLRVRQDDSVRRPRLSQAEMLDRVKSGF